MMYDIYILYIEIEIMEQKGRKVMEKMTNAEHAARFGKQLSAIMYDKKITQSQLAKTIGVPAGTVYNWMHGLRIPRAAAMDEICRVLMCTRADLMDNPAQPTIPPQAVQEPAGASADRDPELVLAALDSAGYSHLRELFEAVKDADQGTVDRITNMVKILQPR